MHSTSLRLGPAPLSWRGFFHSPDPLWDSAMGVSLTRSAPPCGLQERGARRPQGLSAGGSRGGARAAVGGAPAGWRRAQLHRLCHLHLPAGPGPSHSSLCPTPSLCVPVSPRPITRKMTLKASEGESKGGLCTALSDLYLEHLLQKRSGSEVSGARGALGRGVRGQDSGPGGTSRRATSPLCGLVSGGPVLGGPVPWAKAEVASRGCGVLGAVSGCPQQPFYVGLRRVRGLDRVLIKVKETSSWKKVRVTERL